MAWQTVEKPEMPPRFHLACGRVLAAWRDQRHTGTPVHQSKTRLIADLNPFLHPGTGVVWPGVTLSRLRLFAGLEPDRHGERANFTLHFVLFWFANENSRLVLM